MPNVISGNKGNRIYSYGDMSFDNRGNVSYLSGTEDNRTLSNKSGMAYRCRNMFTIRGKTFYKSGGMITGNHKTYYLNGDTMTGPSGKIWYGVKNDDDVFRVLESDN